MPGGGGRETKAGEKEAEEGGGEGEEPFTYQEGLCSVETLRKMAENKSIVWRNIYKNSLCTEAQSSGVDARANV
jgi:hypothetical protein